MTNYRCPHCKNNDLKWIPANEPWHNDHWQCPSCDIQLQYVEYTKESSLPIDTEAEYEWVILDNSNNILAHKKKDEEPVFINAEKAVLEMIKIWTATDIARKNASNMLADLSRLMN